MISDGSSIPVPPNSVDVAYSNQLMEHLHPEDALEQLSNIYRALAQGGVYICITPNRLKGPHDISRDFDAVATGLHLKEYTVGELRRLFTQTGFSRVKIVFLTRKIRLSLPPLLARLCEEFLGIFPHATRRSLASGSAVSKLLGIAMVGTK